MNFGNLAENLAGRVRENINQETTTSFIAKIGEVVAPQLDDDDEYETDSEAGSYWEESDEYDIDDSDIDEEEEPKEEEELVFENANGNEDEVSVEKQQKNDDEKKTMQYEEQQIASRSLFSDDNTLNESLTQFTKDIDVSDIAVEEDGEEEVGLVGNDIKSENGVDKHDLVTDHVDVEDNDDNTHGNKNTKEREPVTSPIENQIESHLKIENKIENEIKSNREKDVIGSTDGQIDSSDSKNQSPLKPTPIEIQLNRLLQEAHDREHALELKLQQSISDKKNATITQNQKQLRALYLSDQKAEEARKKLDQANTKIKKMEKEMEDLKKIVKESNDAAQESENEIKELKEENEILEEQMQEIEEEQEAAQEKIESLEEETRTLQGLKIELQLLKEERDRDKAQIQSTVESASSNVSKICAERDEARSNAQSAQQQLEATSADLEIMKSDLERLTLSNGNLQRALEAFQNERDAELELLDEQRKDADLVQKAANDAKLVALREENDARMREVQNAADMAIKNCMKEIETLEASAQQLRKENKSLRTSLDEAIQRLQMSQEDVIDRTLMKNILLDWHKKRGNGKKQVLELMTNVLHFTEDEKEQVYVGENSTASGAFGKVMGAVAAPLPPAALNVDKLEGDNVREKWVNFLLAETGEEAAKDFTDSS